VRVVYTDPNWALDGDGRVSPSRATIERDVYGDDIAFELGIRENGHFVTEGERFLDYVAGADAVVVYRADVTPELLERAGPGCKVVARQGVGLDNVRPELLRERGVFGFNVPDYCGDEVSTHTAALLLALERGVCVQHALTKANRWNPAGGGVPRRTSLRTLGIVGFGRIGCATCRKLEAFYASVVAYDPYVSSDLMASFGVRKCDELEDLLASADAIVLHPQLTAETKALVNEQTLAVIKPGALLVNTGRGGLVDPAAVLEALRSGRLGGFASDVFSPEDPNRIPAGRELLERDDVVVTAHRAFLSEESELTLRRRVAEGVAHVLRHSEPPPLGRVA
jgi:phosphoglycerate dehydrogenase-like enzyme